VSREKTTRYCGKVAGSADWRIVTRDWWKKRTARKRTPPRIGKEIERTLFAY
jgi:hypothetical protein